MSISPVKLGNSKKDGRGDVERIKPYQWKPGQSGNPKGRPKGQTLKEYARGYFFNMSEEEKEAYIKAVEAKRPGFMLEMAEGRATEDRNIKITVPKPILGGAALEASAEASKQLTEGVLGLDEGKDA